MAGDRIGGFAAEVAQQDGTAVVAVRGEIDMATANELRAALRTAVRVSARVELDLRETTFMDSIGLSVLVAAHRQLEDGQDAIVVREAPPHIRKVLEVSGVGALFEIRAEG